MKKKDIIDLKGKSISELTAIIGDRQKQLARTKLERAVGKQTNVHAAKIHRRAIAIAKTLVKEKVLEVKG